MSNKHRNYNAMSSKPKESTQYEPKEETLVEEGNVVNDNPSYEAPAEAVEVEAKVEGTEEPVLPNKLGVVSNCLRLNVRELPNKRSDVVMIIDSGDTVVIDFNKSTDGWYCVGNGYVMKEFITIK